MRLRKDSRAGAPGKGLGLVGVVVVLAAAGAGVYWWQSPARKIQGDWVAEQSLLPVSTNFSFHGDVFGKGTLTTTSSLAGGGLSLSAGENGSYELLSGENPPTLLLTTSSKAGKTDGVKLAYHFVDNDTLELTPSGPIALKMTLKRKK